ncbi:MAG: hypothetical protein HC822_27360 [Oscillochloris sp.]|nr:hypothetical protein [Oscillochloris sp.]
MTPARHTPAPTSSLPLNTEHRSDEVELQWPATLRTVLLLSGAAHPGDPVLARMTDQELQMLRLTMASLAAPGSTNAA